jgi:hypothetical protein
MADISIWQDKKARAAFVAKGQELFEKAKGELEGQEDARQGSIRETPRSVGLLRAPGQSRGSDPSTYMVGWAIGRLGNW